MHKSTVFTQRNKVAHLAINFNNTPIACQNHLSLYLDENLNFSQHIREKNLKLAKPLQY